MKRLLFLISWRIRKLRLLFTKVRQTITMARRALLGQAVVQVIIEEGIITDVLGLPIGARYDAFDWDILEGGFDNIAELMNERESILLRGIDATSSSGWDATAVERFIDDKGWNGLEDWFADFAIWRW